MDIESLKSKFAAHRAHAVNVENIVMLKCYTCVSTIGINILTFYLKMSTMVDDIEPERQIHGP